MFQIYVVVDIKSEKAIQLREISSIIEQALEAHRMGDVTVKKDEFYELVAVEGNLF